MAVLLTFDAVLRLGGEALFTEVLEKVDLLHEGGVGDCGCQFLRQTLLRPQMLLPVLHPGFYYRILLS